MGILQAACPSVFVSVMQMSDQHRTIEPTDGPDLERMDLGAALHELLVGYVERGIPELVVLGVLREQARAIFRGGMVVKKYRDSISKKGGGRYRCRGSYSGGGVSQGGYC